ncbi:MAG: UDP-glucose/GDP-mannose dehydrogenase family protein [Nanoarchaeota archaeon]|nr:UDP-glucose/GDP-mannose dehydrogenase family protein [Nanoarchaeota archaeon]
MKISIVGAGYVGLIQGVGLAELGHEITLIDIDQDKVDLINKKVPPIHEQGLAEALKKVELKASTSYDSISKADVVFVCVGTPSREDGSINLDYVYSCAHSISENLDKYAVVCVKSTVLPGTTEKFGEILSESGRVFGLAHNPEFLREGTALNDFRNPDRVVVGQSDEKSGDIVARIYESFNCEKLRTSIRASEMIKYVANSFLATKISFANEVANMCENFGVDANEVWEGVALDNRINPKFLRHGAGFGGSCFPKDVKALIHASKSGGYDPLILNSVIETNELQPKRLIKLLKTLMPDVKGKKIGVLGLSFKPGTTDVREAVSLKVIDELLGEGAEVIAYDPSAMKEAKKLLGDKILFAQTLQEALERSDACLVVTEWEEIVEHDFSGFDKPLIDGRGVKKPNQSYRRIGKPF